MRLYTLVVKPYKNTKKKLNGKNGCPFLAHTHGLLSTKKSRECFFKETVYNKGTADVISSDPLFKKGACVIG